MVRSRSLIFEKCQSRVFIYLHFPVGCRFQKVKTPNHGVYSIKFVIHFWACLNCWNLGSVFTLVKCILFSKKKFIFYLKLLFFHNLLWYCHTSSEIMQCLDCNNNDDFQHINFILSQKIVSLFWGLFNHETNLSWVRYNNLSTIFWNVLPFFWLAVVAV
jgi:hypothetical protein